MSQKLESLSALVDGEDLASTSSDNHLIDAVKNDVGLMDKWKSYHLIGDGLRRELPAELNFDIAAKVAEAIESEPAILAPKKTWRDNPIIGNVIPFAKQGGQMAIAASVAVAMILGVQQLNQPELEQPFNAAPPILGIQGGLSPVSLEQTSSVPRANMAEQRKRISVFIADHKDQMRLKTVQPQTGESPKLNGNIENEDIESNVVESTPE